MADTKIRINGLVHASSAELTDRYAIDNEDGITQSVSGQDIADMVATTEFDDLETEDKTLKGAINELVAGGGGGGSSTFAGLTDVDIDTQTLANGQVPKYNSTTQKWENANESGGGGSTVTITPTLATGTKIADYSIDGTSGSLYAPSGGGGSSSYFTVELEDDANLGIIVVTTSADDIAQAVQSDTPIVATYNYNTYWLSLLNDLNGQGTSYTMFFSAFTTLSDGIFTISTLVVSLSYYSDAWSVTAFPTIQSVAYKEPIIRTTTLTAGSTSVVVSVSSLSSGSKIDIYTSEWGVSPTAVVSDTTNKTITLTFEARQADLNIKVEVT